MAAGYCVVPSNASRLCHPLINPSSSQQSVTPIPLARGTPRRIYGHAQGQSSQNGTVRIGSRLGLIAQLLSLVCALGQLQLADSTSAVVLLCLRTRVYRQSVVDMYVFTCACRLPLVLMGALVSDAKANGFLAVVQRFHCCGFGCGSSTRSIHMGTRISCRAGQSQTSRPAPLGNGVSCRSPPSTVCHRREPSG
jgi:hypothetical protein